MLQVSTRPGRLCGSMKIAGVAGSANAVVIDRIFVLVQIRPDHRRVAERVTDPVCVSALEAILGRVGCVLKRADAVAVRVDLIVVGRAVQNPIGRFGDVVLDASAAANTVLVSRVCSIDARAKGERVVMREQAIAVAP